jgi:uncharacterized cupredoxin-like copper-binding protein
MLADDGMSQPVAVTPSRLPPVAVVTSAHPTSASGTRRPGQASGISHSHQPLLVELGAVQVKDTRKRRFTLLNTGKFPLEYSFSLVRTSVIEGESTTRVVSAPADLLHNASLAGRGKLEHEARFWERVSAALHFTPEFGTLKPGEEVQIELSFVAQDPISISSVVATLSITYGNMYYFNISCCAYRPQLNFSWLSNSFGPSFLIKSGTSDVASTNTENERIAASPTFSPTTVVQPKTLSLVISNKEPVDILVEPLFVSDNELRSNASPMLLAPGKSEEVSFVFSPRDVKQYEWKLPFEINSLFTVTITLKGEGISPKIEALYENGVISGHGSHCKNVPKVASLSPSLAILLREDDGSNIASVPSIQSSAPVGPKQSSTAPQKTQTNQQLQLQRAAAEATTQRNAEHEFLVSSAITALESGKRLPLGQLRPGQSVVKSFKLINRSPLPVKLSVSRCMEALHDLDISLAGMLSEISLKPGETGEYHFSFAPKKRLREFAVPVTAEAVGFVVPLVSLTGACLGMEVKFDCLLCCKNLSFFLW